MPTIAFKLETDEKSKNGDSFILVECMGPGNIPHNAAGGLVEKMAQNLKERLKPLSALGDTLRESLTDINNPAKIEVEFGLEVGGEAGFLKILSGSSKANFKVKLTWENKTKGAKDEKQDD